MTRQQRREAQAKKAYQAEMEKVKAMMARIQSKIDADNVDQPTQGQVGDAMHLSAQLKEVCDQMFNEGEYAA